MENEKKLPTTAQELPDEEMDKVAGGTNKHVELIQRKPHWNGTLLVYAVYEWKGADDNKKISVPDLSPPRTSRQLGTLLLRPLQ